METNILKLSTNNREENETVYISNDDSSSQKSKTPPKKKEVNSWDCSTPTNNEKTAKKTTSNWDSSSECHETMVEPFCANENSKDCGNWDSESEADSHKVDELKPEKPGLFQATSLDSYDMSVVDLSDLEKSSLLDIIGSGGGRNDEEDLLLKDIEEDIEEFLIDGNSPKVTKVSMTEVEKEPKHPDSSIGETDSEKVRSNRSEGTPEDTTIWMIPKSERTHSGESTTNLISSSDREKIQKLNVLKNFLKKTKSLSDMEKSKIRRRTARTSRSDYLGSQKTNYNNFLLSEGSNLQWKLEIESKKTEKISGREKFDRSSVFFTEYECRTMTMEKDSPEKSGGSGPVVNGARETRPEGADTGVSPDSTHRQNGAHANRVNEATINELVRRESSDMVFMDVVSLPDMSGRNSFQDQENHRLTNAEVRLRKPDAGPRSPEENPITESWFLLDSTGHYQAVTRNEVSILLNGRSADAVLQGRKEHFIPRANLTDTKSLKDSLGCIQTQESLQHFLREEDTGGEDEGKKSIELERKVENTLFYIQPNMNFTASIRIIPVDSEMIHIWRRTRDSGSLISSEVDLSYPSQDSVDNYQRSIIEHHSGGVRRVVEQKMTEQDDSPFSAALKENQFTDHGHGNSRPGIDYSRLLMETRNIVDSLSDNFKAIQNRLDGETNRSVALQGEVNDLKIFLKKFEGKFPDKNLREAKLDAQTNPGLGFSIHAVKDKTDLRSKSIIEECEESSSTRTLLIQRENRGTKPIKHRKSQNTDAQTAVDLNEDNDIITVNIYTVESIPFSKPFLTMPPFEEAQETYSLVQSNLTMIENKMRRLQQENDIVKKQNMNLKRKLREISMELEKYLASTSQDSCVDEGKELETLRDQVCNLKLELENSKNFSRNREEELTQENSLIQEEFTKVIIILKNWCEMACEIFEKLQTAKGRLQEIGIVVDVNMEPETMQNPKNFSNLLSCYMDRTINCLVKMKEENNLYEETLKDVREGENPSKEISGLNQVISGYGELIDQCRKGQITGGAENKIMEDYFVVIMEKASLMEEIKILKTENEMLLESQMEHYEKLKQAMIALKDRNNDVTALETSQKLLEDERKKMADMLKLYEEEKRGLEEEIFKKCKIIEDMVGELGRKELEISECGEKLKAAADEINNLEESCQSKEALISEIKAENDELLNVDGMKNREIEILKEELQNLEIRGTQLEGELTSTKVFLSESQKEMTDYITHLETLVSNSQESLDKTKQKLKESNQTINLLKNDNDVLEKQHQCDVKLFNCTKDELNSCKENLLKAKNELNELEKEREELMRKLESLVKSEREKSEALEILVKEFKVIYNENAELKEKVETYSKDKEESIKEHKDLINKYAMLSKEIHKLQEKYRNVKSECNERTDLIRYLDMMLKENLVEYNNKIACLEQNISQIIEKIIAYKNGMREKHFGVDAEVKELRHQLDVTYQERKELENVINNYYSLMKHLENEIKEREKKNNELHVKLSMEQQKAIEFDNSRRSFPNPIEGCRSSERARIEELETQIAAMVNELAECKKELDHCHTNYENERKKFELTIADLKSEVKRYQLRIEVMMRNLTNCNKNTNGLITDKRNPDDSNMQALKKEIEEKNKLIKELNDTINKYKAEIKLKESNLENSKKKNCYLDEELKTLQNKISQMQSVMSASNKTNEMKQKEKDEMAEKLFQSVKLIMEERTARQSIESLAMEKEKNFKNQIEQIKDELVLKDKKCESLSKAVEDKKKLVIKLQSDLKKMKLEMASLKEQVNNYKGRNDCKGNEDIWVGEELTLPTPTAPRAQNVSPERLESCLRELKEVRDLNLQLRKTEGQSQAKIIRLEDEIRDARLLIKELQGDIKTEKKSKKAYKNMILAAKMEIEKCLLTKQLMSVVAERISRHLDMSEIPSRELLSGFRLSDSSSSSKVCS